MRDSTSTYKGQTAARRQLRRITNKKWIHLLAVAILILGFVRHDSTKALASGGVIPNYGTGSVHIVLSHLFRAESDPADRYSHRLQVMSMLHQAGVKYGRETLNWNAVSGGDCTMEADDSQWYDYPGNADWSEYDQVFQLYHAYGIEPVVQIIRTPVNCAYGTDGDRTRYPPSDCKYDGGDCYSLKNFVDAAVLRYGPGGTASQQWGFAGVHYWEIWNEPDLYNPDGTKGWFEGTYKDYARLLRVSYKRIEAIDPSATVLIGGMTWYIADVGTPERLFFLNLMQHIKDNEEPEFGTIFDKFNFHDYSNHTKIHVTGTPGEDDGIQPILNQHGFQDREIWITEIGRATDPPLSRAALADVMFNKMKPEGVPSVGVERVFWFAASDFCPAHLQDPNNGLAHHGLIDCSLNPTPYLYSKYRLLFHNMLYGNVTVRYGGAVEGATVTIAGLTDVTDENGDYKISPLPYGSHTATCSHPLHSTLSDVVVIDEPQNNKDWEFPHIHWPPW